MTATSAQFQRWSDLPQHRDRCWGGGGQLAAARDGAHWTHIIAADNATRDFAAADELRAPDWLSVEDMQREMGQRA